MTQRSFFLLLTLGLLGAALSSCATIEGEPMAFEGQSITVRVDRKYVDEDSPLENQIIFRNIGTEVVSFDYTVADVPGVRHIDMNGPNSGLVENLYPGAEIKVANPTNLKEVFTSLGTVAYGKKTPEQIGKLYNPGGSLASSSMGGDLAL